MQVQVDQEKIYTDCPEMGGFMIGNREYIPEEILDLEKRGKTEIYYVEDYKIVEGAGNRIIAGDGVDFPETILLSAAASREIPQVLQGNRAAARHGNVKLFDALKYVEELRSQGRKVRNEEESARQAVYYGKRSSYTLLGTIHVHQGGGLVHDYKGLESSEGTPEDVRDRIGKRVMFDSWIKKYEHVAKQYLPAHVVKILETINVTHKETMEETGKNVRIPTLWPSVACGRNAVLCVHVDMTWHGGVL
jgi:hypothetical protein